MSTFIPRLNDNGMQGNRFWYADNPFYQSGYGLPNCTAYAWGRRYELTNERPNTSLSNADRWWDYNLTNNIYPSGQEPQLGAIACWKYTGAQQYDGGHVAIVEVIDGDKITLSNSGWGYLYFYLDTTTRQQGWEIASYSSFQGFIYLDGEPVPPIPPIPPIGGKSKLPLWMYTRKKYKWR